MSSFAQQPVEGVAPYNPQKSYGRGEFFYSDKKKTLFIASGAGGAASFHSQGSLESEAIWAELHPAPKPAPAAKPIKSPAQHAPVAPVVRANDAGEPVYINPDSGKVEKWEGAVEVPEVAAPKSPLLEILHQMQEEAAFVANERFTRLVLNRAPKKDDIKIEDNNKGGMRHIPIHILRAKLDEIFGGQTEFSLPKLQLITFAPDPQGYSKILVMATVTLTVTYPVTGFRRTVFGAATGAAGASYKNNAMAAEVATSNAEKNAIIALGRFFGRDLNKDSVQIVSLDEKVEMVEAAVESRRAGKNE